MSTTTSDFENKSFKELTETTMTYKGIFTLTANRDYDGEFEVVHYELSYCGNFVAQSFKLFNTSGDMIGCYHDGEQVRIGCHKGKPSKEVSVHFGVSDSDPGAEITCSPEKGIIEIFVDCGFELGNIQFKLPYIHGADKSLKSCVEKMLQIDEMIKKLNSVCPECKGPKGERDSICDNCM